ncbi:MAG: TRAP-type mannitol/chloroaromatic compound transport system substrate-binding protein [Planctomycetota bacterium]
MYFLSTSELVRFSDDLLKGAREASRQLLSDAAAGDAGYAKILASWESFKNESFQWFGLAEQSYASFVSPPS